MEAKKAILMILDGWGIGNASKADVISSTPTPRWDALLKQYPHSQLKASGEDVGLPTGQMGNSEVGHLNIGAGRVVYQDLVKINKACEDNSIKENAEIVKAFTYAQKNDKKVHLLGLVSDGGVHSSMDHLFKLCEIGADYNIDKLFVHCFMDGRDTDPQSGKAYLTQLQEQLSHTTGYIGTIVGRYYAMDRDQRWDRVKVAYDAMVAGIGEVSDKLLDQVAASYEAGVTDEFIKPIINASVDSKITAGDVVIFFNFRNDRPKEMTQVLTQKDMPEEGMETLPLHFCTMTPYDSSFKGLHILFDKENVKQTLGEVLAEKGKKQLRIAETEKFAHVTFFFSGGRESEFELEDRILVNSPKVATYDLQPEMSAFEVKDKVVEALNSQEYDFICLNFANGDMVGHTGVYDAIVQAIQTVDTCVGEVVDASIANDYEVIIIADHGNADYALNDDQSPNTAHSLNPVPFVYVTQQVGLQVKDGILADVAPSICKVLGIAPAAEMTGEALIVEA